MSFWKRVARFFSSKSVPVKEVKGNEGTKKPSKIIGDWAPPTREVKRVEITQPTVVSKRRRREKSASGVSDQVAEAREEVVIREFEDFYTLLRPIERFIPLSLNKRCVKAILLWFWEERFIANNYIRFQYFQYQILSKGFLSEEFVPCVRWLIEEIKLVTPNETKTGGKWRLVSLRMKARKADSAQVRKLLKILAKIFYDFDRAVGR